MSGFSYPEWVGEVYPSGTKRTGMLSAYADIFSAVEINSTFRRTPLGTTISRWNASVPESFVFTVKAHQRITHWKRLVDAAEEVDVLVKACEGLQPKLGPILFQLPPNLSFDPAVLEGFGTGLVPGHRYALEPRDASFLSTDGTDVLSRHGIALCLNDELFDPARYVRTGPVAYLRFRKIDYAPGELEERADLARNHAADGTDVYVIFRHTDDPRSVRPALRFLELLGDR